MVATRSNYGKKNLNDFYHGDLIIGYYENNTWGHYSFCVKP
jgi:hypothetical protein